jgi:hypothetical protein
MFLGMGFVLVFLLLSSPSRDVLAVNRLFPERFRRQNRHRRRPSRPPTTSPA